MLLSGPAVGPEEERLVAERAKEATVLEREGVNRRVSRAGCDAGFLYPGMMMDQLKNRHRNKTIIADSFTQDEGLTDYEDVWRRGRSRVHPTRWENSPIDWSTDVDMFGNKRVGVDPELTRYRKVFSDYTEDLTHDQMKVIMDSTAGKEDYSAYLADVGKSVASLETPTLKNSELHAVVQRLKEGKGQMPDAWTVSRQWEREADLMALRLRQMEYKRANDASLARREAHEAHTADKSAYEYEQARLVRGSAPSHMRTVFDP